MCMKSHQTIFSLFPVKKIEWYLFFKANTKYNKLYCNTLINPDLFLLFLLTKCDLCHVVKNKQKCHSEIHKTLPSISDSFSTTLMLTDNWNMSNLGSTTHNLTVLPIYLTLAIQFRTSFLTTSWAGGKMWRRKRKREVITAPTEVTAKIPILTYLLGSFIGILAFIVWASEALSPFYDI